MSLDRQSLLDLELQDGFTKYKFNNQMKLANKTVILIVAYFIFSLSVLFADSNSDENDNIETQDSKNDEMTELEELNTMTSLSMDKEIVFPRDI